MTDEAHSADPQTGPPPEANVPPLGIRHLMLWTACCGLFLGIWRALTGDAPPSVALLLVYTLNLGAAGAACALINPWNRAGIRFPKQPGEWMLVLTGTTMIVSVLIAVMVQLFPPLLNRPQVALAVLWLSPSWLYLIPLALARVPTRWKVAFALLLTEMVLTALERSYLLAGRYSDGATWLCLAALSIVAIADWRGTQRYRWTHWVGVAFAWLTYLMAAIFY